MMTRDFGSDSSRIGAAPQVVEHLQGLAEAPPLSTAGAMMADAKNRPTLCPDDERHGTYAGYSAGCHEDCCLVANRRYTKLLVHEHAHGKRRTVDATGFRRRIRALQALGWSVEDLARMIGVHGSNLRRDLVRNQRVKVERHRQIADLYERLCMTPADHPDAKRLRTLAARRGYLPPLAWDDIDNDPSPVVSDSESELVDEVKVQRTINGWLEDCNPAERLAVIDRWEGSINELERLTGWHVHRTINSRGNAA